MNPFTSFRHRLETLVRTAPAQPTPLFSLETPLALASSVYGGAMAARASLYKKGVFKSGKLPCYVISIGNLTAGGTGKTPMTLFVARLLRDLGYTVAVVSRGYRGQMETSGGVVSDGRRLFQTAAKAGDEPFLMACLLTGIPVVVGKNRYQAGLLAHERFNPDVVVLDDGFQHLKLKRDLNLVLMDATHPFGNGQLIPRGLLREPATALNRAQGIILTRCADPAEFSNSDERRFSGKPVFKTCHQQIIRTFGRPLGQTLEGKTDRSFFSHTRPLSTLNGKRVIAFSGLADNAQFFDSLRDAGCEVVKTVSFPDHHAYLPPDVDRLAEKCRNFHVDAVVTTAKDAVKIDFPCTFPAEVIAVDVRIQFSEIDRFTAFLLDRLPARKKQT